MRSGGGSSGHIGMYVGEDWWMQLWAVRRGMFGA